MFSGTCRSLARCHPARSTCITIKESAKVLATCESQEIHHGGISCRQDQGGHFPLCWSHGCVDVGIFTHDLSWGARPHAGRSPSASRLTDPRHPDPHLQPSAAPVAHRWAHESLLPPGRLLKSFFKSRLLFRIGLGMARTRNQLAPPMSMQQAIDGAFIDERAPTCASNARLISPAVASSPRWAQAKKGASNSRSCSTVKYSWCRPPLPGVSRATGPKRL